MNLGLQSPPQSQSQSQSRNKTQKGKNKRQAPKSRTGCESCKKRRRRCDETKPGCYECQRRGQTCPGYTRPFIRWRHMHKKTGAGGGETPSESLGSSAAGDFNLSAEDGIDLDLLTGITESDMPEPLPAVHDAVALSGAAASSGDRDYIENLEILRRRLTDTSVPSFLVYLPGMLVEYYFDYVCMMWSSFDSDINPFRTNIARLWSQNAPIYFAIQSMAAASLAGDFPGMRSVGTQMQQRAISALQEAMASSPMDDENLFYALLMVGSTTAWHNGGDLGLPYLQAARRFLVRQRQRHQGSSSELAQQYPFFNQCLLYWNMLAAFVAQDIPDAGVTDSDLPIYVVNGQTLLHPWTGPLPTALRLFYQIARLIRSARHAPLISLATTPGATLESTVLFDAVQAHKTAEQLEKDLLTFDVDGIGHHLPTGDSNTPASHFTILADAYRCVALLQIYHAFPEILVSRLQSQSQNDLTTALPRQLRRLLALHIITLLDHLPISSGTRVMQPVLLAATAGSLVFSTGTPLGVAADALGPFDIVDVDIAQARRRVTTRLADLTRILPKPPLERIIDLVKETWAKADDGGDAFWLDVMMEHHLETIMG
ncbi:Zn(II)2Cys6 transcription factor [Aspergillus homomorphus CBS 101889]|uniref:Zn(2)-C6 fungal-type domain-containing protein n=1 Tax=Aspergillus homomorphus (strain CBS 101889) TaxID=1450537 RepID=A0A395HXJ4_ASPHC|nr:hypothetical protein BO97DRAFT_348198 [Aspergillus homomorphus CBS 101889]RAL10964.1 hypothetical protein BO97DRAFT_348198 [Aspergillus homomorphus CBS 101889]